MFCFRWGMLTLTVPVVVSVSLELERQRVEGGRADSQGQADARFSDHEGTPTMMRREGSGVPDPPVATLPEYHSILNKVVQSSPDTVSLDGGWTTASGLQISINGTNVEGPSGSGYREVILIRNGGRRVEMHVADETSKVAYWGVLNGRGSINWNDGDVWSRKIDCVWQPWSIFGACGGPCPKGMQQRRRGFEFLQENGGSPCRGPKEECRLARFCPGFEEARLSLNLTDMGFVTDDPQEVLNATAANGTMPNATAQKPDR